jgi:prepilin-type N-terminal cleavage/methylation domain-containing protein
MSLNIRHTSATRRRSGRRGRGFTIPELLLSMALLGALLAAVAAAVHASVTSYTENDKSAAITQTARSVLSRMQREIRTAEAVECPSSSWLRIAPVDDGSGLTLIEYIYNGGKLYYRKTTNGELVTMILLGAPDDRVTVSSFNVSRTSGQMNGYSVAKLVKARITFTIEGEPMVLTTSAAPRRNQEY